MWNVDMDVKEMKVCGCKVMGPNVRIRNSMKSLEEYTSQTGHGHGLEM